MKKRVVAAVMCVVAVVAGPGATAVAQSQRFPDVPTDHYAFEAVEWAAEVGVTTGYDDGTFKPQRPLSKRHAVVFMGRYYDEILGADQSDDFTRGDMMVLLKAINDGTLRGETLQDPAPDTDGTDPAQRFPDVPADHYAFEAVEWAAEVGVTTGYNDGTFKPQRPLSKRHAVVFMERYYDEILGADQSDDFTRGDMMVLLKAINDGTLRNTGTVGAGGYTDIAVGWTLACGLHSDGTVDCWGTETEVSNKAELAAYNGLENTLSLRQEVDTPAGSYKDISHTSEGDCSLLALKPDGIIECWQWSGELNAIGGSPASLVVSDGSGLPEGVFLSVDDGCGIRTDRSVICWEWDYSDDIFDEWTYTPDGTFRSVSRHNDDACAIRTDDTITCWSDRRLRISPGGTFRSVSLHHNACAIRTDDTIRCWGDDYRVTQPPDGAFESVAVSSFGACAIRTDGTVACWNDGKDQTAFQLLLSLPLLEAPEGTFTAIAAHEVFAAAIRTDGSVAFWGTDFIFSDQEG